MLYFYFFIYLTIKHRKSIFYTVFVVELFAIFDRFHMKPNRSKQTEEKHKRIVINRCHTINFA